MTVGHGRVDRPLRRLPAGDPGAATHARIVVDHFHLVRGANTALDAVRRERQRERRTRGPKGTRRSGQHLSWRQHLFHCRHRLLRAREKLTLCELFEREPLVAGAWGLKEAFRSIYRSLRRHQAERLLDAFLAAVDRAQIPPFTAFAATDTPKVSSTRSRSSNAAYGLPTFGGFRARVLIACG